MGVVSACTVQEGAGLSKKNHQHSAVVLVSGTKGQLGSTPGSTSHLCDHRDHDSFCELPLTRLGRQGVQQELIVYLNSEWLDPPP